MDSLVFEVANDKTGYSKTFTISSLDDMRTCFDELKEAGALTEKLMNEISEGFSNVMANNIANHPEEMVKEAIS